ncbi:hypothetical protein F2Q69_00006846 [Brassica cretica]|uniref:Uncharacterized protein n=1 Tax=Brassica cretica TaxID=69181 RepID=A0A8S9NYS1_BRACR|nr:hypothetical protein F2Q69_00006846 [Brassica cretica]
MISGLKDDVVGAAIVHEDSFHKAVAYGARFGFPVSYFFLALPVLFLAAAWLMPLISDPPKMTWITRFCCGSEAGIAMADCFIASLFRRFLALSERNSMRCPFFSSSLTSILSAITVVVMEVAPPVRVPVGIGGGHLLRPLDMLAHLPQNIY